MFTSAGEEKGGQAMIAIERIDAPAIDRIAPLVAEADAAGFRALARLVDDWDAGRNRFDRPGEALFIATVEGAVVGVCGLNIDPYLADPEVGRVRHLYVAAHRHRQGVGARLVGVVVAEARGLFTHLRLRTDSPESDAFYRSLGFARVADEPGCTHRLALDAETPATSGASAAPDIG